MRHGVAQELAHGRIDSKTGKDLSLPLQNVCSLLLTLPHEAPTVSASNHKVLNETQPQP